MKIRMRNSRRKRSAVDNEENDEENVHSSSEEDEPARKRRVRSSSRGIKGKKPTENGKSSKSGKTGGNYEYQNEDEDGETSSGTSQSQSRDPPPPGGEEEEEEEEWAREPSPGINANALTLSMFDDSGLISPLEDFDAEDDTDEIDSDATDEPGGDNGDRNDEGTKRRTAGAGSCSTAAVDKRNNTHRASKRSRSARSQQNGLISSSDDSTAKEEDEEANEEAKKSQQRKKRPQTKAKSTTKMPRCCSPVWSCLTAKEKEKSEGLKSGTIKSLRLYNFMCHESFYQEWHPNINFIVGENGSGKSALLSGMLIGLGAKATVTSRSRSTTDLIMKGKDSARTQLVLTNKGHLSVTKYGREFMLERTISKSGSSTYRIKAEGHNWRPLKRNELDYILMVLNIQLDNPVAILNQEVAKNFLRTKDPKDKYQLFYMGTLLQRLFGLLADSRVDIDASAKNLEIHKRIIDEMRTSVHSMRKQLKEFENLRRLSEKITALEAEYLWALVIDEETTQTTLQGKLTEMDTKKEQFLAKIADMKSKMEETVVSEDLVEQSRALKRELEEKEKLKDAMRLEKHGKVVQQTTLKTQIRSMQTEISNKKGEKSIVERTLSQILSVSEEDEERFMREYETKKTELQDKKAEILQTLTTLRNDGEQFKNGADSVGERLINIENEHAVLLKDIDMKKRLLANIDGPNRNKYAAYGQHMEELVKKLELNANKFKKPPRGPIGSYITVKNPKYTKLVEDILMTKDLPCGFIVDNSNDLRLMQKLTSETYGNITKFRPAILTNPFMDSAHDVRNGEARMDGVSTLLDMIEVENNDPVIINALVDYMQAERILMFETNSAACAVMKNSSRVPRTCGCGFTLEWYKISPVPNYAARTMRKLQNLNFIHASKKDQKQSLQRDLQQLKLQVEAIRPQLEETKKEKSRLLKQCSERRTEYEKKKRELAQIDKEMMQNETNKYQAPDVASHREELQSLTDALAVLEEKKEETSQRLDELQAQIQGLVEQIRLVDLEIPKIHAKMTSIESEKDNNAKKVEQLRQLIVRIEAKMKLLDTQRTPIVTELEHCQAELNRKLEQATADTEQRVQTTRTAEDVKKDFELIKRQRKEMQKQLGNQRELQVKYDKLNQEFTEKCKEYDPLYNSFVILRDLVESQLIFLFKKRAEISNGLTFTYTALAQQRGYKGQMVVNHDTKELHFFICPDKSSSSKTDVAVRNDDGKQSQKALIEYSLGLSGGERSFSTICFILSLWQIMECPFYMLDEFDVYMDALNRKASQNALITHAKAYQSDQFFLYTPLELCEIPEKKDALTLRLRPARPTEGEAPQPPSPVTDNETENVNPQARSGGAKGKKGGRNRNAPAMSEKNRATPEY